MIDMNDHTVDDVLRYPEVADGFREMPAESSLLAAIDILKLPKTRIIVAVDQNNASPVGVLLRGAQKVLKYGKRKVRFYQLVFFHHRGAEMALYDAAEGGIHPISSQRRFAGRQEICSTQQSLNLTNGRRVTKRRPHRRQRACKTAFHRKLLRNWVTTFIG